MNIRTKLFLTLLVVNITLLVLLAVILEMEVNHHFGLLMSQEMNLISPSMSQSMQFHFGQALRQSLIWTVLSFIAITMAIAIFVSKRFTRRIQLMRRQAKQIANGQWDATLPVEGRDELSSLSHTLNYLESLARIVWNLLDNAVKFTPEQGNIHLVVASANRESFLQVEDSGIGIPEEERGNIFERFYRVGKSRDRRKGGSGLGSPL